MKRVAIPALLLSDNAMARHAEAVKHNVDMITGQHRNSATLKPLATTADLPTVIAQLNAILARLQGDT